MAAHQLPNHENEPRAVIQWPPTVILEWPLVYMTNVFGIKYPRDIGRSSHFTDGSIFVQFGDTFCHDIDGNFVGMANNTCALVTDDPTLVSYSPTQKVVDPKGTLQIPNFIGPSDEEQRWHDDLDVSLGIEVEAGTLHKYWSFSGMVEYRTEGDVICAWTWFEKLTFTPGKLDVYVYTGVANVHYNTAIRKIHTKPPFRLFEPGEPALGVFCALRDGVFIYVYGHMPGSKNIALGRVPKDHAANRSEYQYLTHPGPGIATALDPDNPWTSCIQDCLPVPGLNNLQHGQIFRTEMWPTSLNSPWAFVGCNAEGDSQVIIGRSPAPEGPFTTVKLMTANSILQMPSGQPLFTYCMYPHPWAAHSNTGELMISWSEGTMNGSVIMTKVGMRTVEDGKENEQPDASNTWSELEQFGELQHCIIN